MATLATTNAQAHHAKSASTTIPTLPDGWQIHHNMPTRYPSGYIHHKFQAPTKPRLRPSLPVAIARDWVQHQQTSRPGQTPHATHQSRTALLQADHEHLLRRERRTLSRQKTLERLQDDLDKSVQKENYDFNNDQGRYGYENFPGCTIPEWEAAKQELFARATIKFDGTVKHLMSRSREIRWELDEVQHNIDTLKRVFQQRNSKVLNTVREDELKSTSSTVERGNEKSIRAIATEV